MDNPKVQISPSRRIGNGLFAVQWIEAGEEIAAFDGKIYTCTHLLEHLPNDPPLYIEDHAIPFHEFKARDSIGFARCANHSCNPNCGIKNLFRIVAMRDIRPGEEITWDYDMAQDDEIWDMECLCGAASCRGRVAGYRFLPPKKRRQYKGFISEWLLETDRPFLGLARELMPQN